MRRWIVGVTGASGICYGLRLIRALTDEIDHVHVVFSDAALRVLNDEEGIATTHGALAEELFSSSENLTVHNPRDIGASIASGSMVTEGMVIVPCSMATLGALAHGVSQHLVHRAAEVVLKEGRRLIVVPRETPLTPIYIENMAILSRAGARIVPAMPGFYHKPKTIDDLVDMMVMRILDQMSIHTDLAKRWQGKEKN